MRDFFLYIQTFNALPHFPRLSCVGKETRSSASCRVEGRWRKNRPRVIFQYTLAGRGLFKDRTGEHVMGGGSGFLCEAHDPKMAYYYPADATAPWHFLFIDLVGEAAHVMARDLIRRFGGIYSLPPDNAVIQRLLSFRVYDRVGCALTVGESAHLAMDLLLALAVSHSAVPETHPDHDLIRRTQEIVQSEISNRITVSEIAGRLNVSQEHLTRVFKQRVGQSPYKYIQNAKMLAACGLLKSEAISIKEVASRLGYAAADHFVRTFHRVMHATPGQFRRHGIIPVIPDPREAKRR